MVQVSQHQTQIPNLVVLATHGGYFIPPELESRLTQSFKDQLLLKNFSDFATEKLLPQFLPERQKVINRVSRALGDTNRAPDATDLFREVDFSGNPIWDQPLNEDEKQMCLEMGHSPYHREVEIAIENAEENNQTVFVFDIHDTGRMLDPSRNIKRPGGFPTINLGDRNGTASNPEITAHLADVLTSLFGDKPTINAPYDGGYVTQKYGEHYNNSLPEDQKFARNVIQVEMCRSLYMDENMQALDPGKIEEVREKLEQAMVETVKAFS